MNCPVALSPNLDWELGLIGSLITNHWRQDILAVLTPQDFMDDVCREIFRTWLDSPAWHPFYRKCNIKDKFQWCSAAIASAFATPGDVWLACAVLRSAAHTRAIARCAMALPFLDDWRLVLRGLERSEREVDEVANMSLRKDTQWACLPS